MIGRLALPWRWLCSLGLWPRLLLAALPAPLGAMAWQWHSSCVFDRYSGDPGICLVDYFWYPPVMDVLFGLLVLAPWVGAGRLVAIRVALLVLVSVVVHAVATELAVATRGAIELKAVDSIFLNVIPIAFVASLVTAGATAWLSDARHRPRLWLYAGAAGLSCGLVFLFQDLGHWFQRLPVPGLWRLSEVAVWLVWHVAMAAALYLGLRRSPRA